jgi:hypothetical protein
VKRTMMPREHMVCAVLFHQSCNGVSSSANLAGYLILYSFVVLKFSLPQGHFVTSFLSST